MFLFYLRGYIPQVSSTISYSFLFLFLQLHLITGAPRPIMKEDDQVHMSDDKSVPTYDNGKEELRDSSSGVGEVQVGETTKRGLKARHAQMIALGGTIGTGLFVGSGGTLARGGPLFILIAYSTIAMLVLFVVTAIVEVAAYLPIS